MISAIALFCEDIREEKSGMVTVIGIFTDNINVPSIPFMFPKLSIYGRFALDTTKEPPREIALRLTHPNSKDMDLTVFDASIIQGALRESREKGAATSGLISTAIISPFQVRQAGRINAVAKVDGEDVICGTLNVQLTNP